MPDQPPPAAGDTTRSIDRAGDAADGPDGPERTAATAETTAAPPRRFARTRRTVGATVAVTALLFGFVFGAAPAAAATTSRGVQVQRVSLGTPAQQAGIRVGDVITAVDGVPVTTVDELDAALAAYDEGDWVAVSFTDAAGRLRASTLEL